MGAGAGREAGTAMGREGYIKLYRKIWDNPVAAKDADHMAVWVWLLTEAAYRPQDAMFGGRKITLRPGQLVTGRRKISLATRVTESKVQRILKLFENEQLIEQQTSSRNRLVSIARWDAYQACEQRGARQMNNRCTTNEQQVDTYKESNKKRNKNIIINARTREGFPPVDKNEPDLDFIGWLKTLPAGKRQEAQRMRLEEHLGWEEIREAIGKG